jgi:hypothetical protein
VLAAGLAKDLLFVSAGARIAGLVREAGGQQDLVIGAPALHCRRRRDRISRDKAVRL